MNITNEGLVLAFSALGAGIAMIALVIVIQLVANKKTAKVSA